MMARRVICVAGALLIFAAGAPPALAAQTDLPSLEQQAQQLLEQAPISLEAFLQDPWGVLSDWLRQSLLSTVAQEAASYASLLLYLLLAGTMMLCIAKSQTGSILEFICTAGAFLLISSSVLELVREFCGRVTEWKSWLISFAPVFSAVLAAGGRPTLAAAYNGFFLSALQLLSYGIEQFLVPLLNCYLAVSAAGALSGMDEVHSICRMAGEGIKKAVKLAALIFTAIMGVQRTFGSASDSAALKASQAISSAIPVIGQTMAAASSTVASAVSMLSTGAGFAAIAVIGAEFLPFFFRILLQLFFLYLCALLCKVFHLSQCETLFQCTGVAVEAVCAVAALFFFMIVVATALMTNLGGG